MKYKLTRNSLKTDLTIITLNEKNHHIEIIVKYDKKDYYKLNVKILSSIATELVESSFKRKVILIHCYKLLERFRTNPKGLKQELKNCNYAQVFGTPWL